MAISITDKEWDELTPENFETTALLRAVDAITRRCALPGAKWDARYTPSNCRF